MTLSGNLFEGSLQSIFGYQLAQASVTADQIFEACAARPLGLRKVEYTLLCLITNNPGVKPVQLAKALSFTAPNTTNWIDKLVNKDFVERRQNTADKRSQNLQITDLGRRLAAQATEAILAAESQCLEALTEGERLILSELLRKVARAKAPK